MEINKKLIFLLVTHSSYFDICEIFLKLINKNLNMRNIDLVITYCGDEINIDGYKMIYNGKDATLPDCIHNAVNIINSDYYFCFLGDAFFTDLINEHDIFDLKEKLKFFDLEYCCLIPRKKRVFHKIRLLDEDAPFRLIEYSDLYCHSFIAFAASKDFIQSEFKEKTTDLDFELKYLKKAEKKGYYDKRGILTENIFNIHPGIQKGKWDWRVWRLLNKKTNGAIKTERVISSWWHSYLKLCIIALQPVMPISLRRIVKHIISKLKIGKVVTKY